MIIFESELKLSKAKLLENDLVQVMGKQVLGDFPVRFGKVFPSNHTPTNPSVTLANNLIVEFMPVTSGLGGTSSERPNTSELAEYTYYFDTTLNKAIWWVNGNWVDAVGNLVV